MRCTSQSVELYNSTYVRVSACVGNLQGTCDEALLLLRTDTRLPGSSHLTSVNYITAAHAMRHVCMCHGAVPNCGTHNTTSYICVVAEQTTDG